MNYENIFINGLIGTIYNSQGEVEQKGVELIDVIKQVQNAPFADGYNVYINSEGGVVETGFEIYDYLRSIGKPINTIGVSQVASIATIVFMAGDSRKLKTGTNFLIHLPMIGIDGFLNSQELEQAKIDLAPVEKRLIDFYKKTTGLTEEAIAPLLKRETSLNPSDAFDLKFATEYDVEFTKAVAYLKKDNLNTNNQMTENDKSWIEEKFSGILNLIKGKEPKKGFNVVSLKKGTIVNVDVTDANGVIITFPDVAEGTMPTIGDTAVIDGKPAEGEYLMPDGNTYVFVAGELTQIVEAGDVEVDVVDTLTAEIAQLKEQLATQTTNYEQAVVNLKAQIVSKFETKEPKDAPKEEQKQTSRKLLKD
jgi:ATP-dependent protease ClpP protease subunit